MKAQDLASIFIVIIQVLSIIYEPFRKLLVGDEADKLFVAIGIHFLFMGSVLYLQMLKLSKDFSDSQDDSQTRFTELKRELQKSIPNSRIELISSSSFYTEFLDAAAHATTHVKISYLSPSPPDEEVGTERRDYYKEIAKLPKKKPNCSFMRIVREPNDDALGLWIASHIVELAKANNTYLAMLPEIEHAFSLALAVQVVDTRTWLVAIKGHEQRGEYRDARIENSDFARAMIDYYERLWDLSTVLVEAGKITPEGRELISKYKKEEGGT